MLVYVDEEDVLNRRKKLYAVDITMQKANSIMLRKIVLELMEMMSSSYFDGCDVIKHY